MPMKSRYTVVDGEVIAQKRNGVRTELVPDPLGSTVAIVDSAQAVTDTASYYPYGEVASRTGSTVTPFQFVGTLGYYQDAPTRSYVRARYLDSYTGRWITQDPIWFQGGVNLFNYVSSAPTVFRDPTGLELIKVHSTNIDGSLAGPCYYMDVPDRFANIMSDVDAIIARGSLYWEDNNDSRSYYLVFYLDTRDIIGHNGTYDFRHFPTSDPNYIPPSTSDSCDNFNHISDLRGKAGNFLYGALVAKLGWSLTRALNGGNVYANRDKLGYKALGDMMMGPYTGPVGHPQYEQQAIQDGYNWSVRRMKGQKDNPNMPCPCK